GVDSAYVRCIQPSVTLLTDQDECCYPSQYREEYEPPPVRHRERSHHRDHLQLLGRHTRWPFVVPAMQSLPGWRELHVSRSSKVPEHRYVRVVQWVCNGEPADTAQFRPFAR